MPIVQTGERVMVDTGEFRNKDMNYDYPNGLNLKPGTPLHDTIATRILQRANESATIMRDRWVEWAKTDEKLIAYIPTSDYEKRVKDKDSRKPISIVFPYSYAILETILSYMVAAFFPEPIFRYEGASDDAMVGAMLMERVINQHIIRNKVALNMHTWFRDAGAYGFGAVSPDWTVHYGRKIVAEEQGFFSRFQKFFGNGNFDKQEVETVLFEGNALDNIDPYKYLPDVGFPIQEVQKGEYVGWGDKTNLMDLLSEEQDDPDKFNGRYVAEVKNKISTVFRLDESGRTRRTGNNFDWRQQQTISNQIDRIHMYIKLIPRQWKLGPSENPQKWLFTLSADSIITTAKQVDFTHDMFPVSVIAPDFDGYSPIAYSRIEILSGMQTVIDWLFNSHITNVRKAINDMLIVDPFLINVNDLRDPEPGKLIRLRRPAWGKGVDKAVQQLPIVDITKQNMEDVMLTINYMQQIAGTDNTTMGTLRKGGPERLSAAEYSGTAQGAVSRLERVAKIIGLQGMQDLGYMFAHHTQQFMEEETYVKLVGSWPQKLEALYGGSDRAKVSPYDVLVDYELITRDGSVPGGNFAPVWQQLFNTIGSNEELLQRFDIVQIFKHIALNLGAKNVDQFERRQEPQVIQPQTGADEAVLAEAARGNLIPLGAA